MYRKDSPVTIQSMFNSIAKRYDFTNAVLSLSLHKRWNRALVQQMHKNSSAQVLIDLCSGTGDIAFDYLKKANHPCEAHLIDFSSEMLEYAKQKANEKKFVFPHLLSYIEADVQSLPLPDRFAEHATMAYGIRNVQNAAKCIREVFRVLKPGGSFGILELTRPQSPVLRLGHQLYLRTFMPLLGKWLTRNKQAYEYLCQSIQTFIAPQELENLLTANGFVNTQRYSLTGGIATMIIGQKPSN